MDIEQIARTTLDIETLETRHVDSLDFHVVSVWGVKHALQQAFNAGVEAAKKQEQREIQVEYLTRIEV